MLAPITEMYSIIFYKPAGLQRFPILMGKKSQNKSHVCVSGVSSGGGTGIGELILPELRKELLMFIRLEV